MKMTCDEGLGIFLSNCLNGPERRQDADQSYCSVRACDESDEDTSFPTTNLSFALYWKIFV